MTLRSSSFAFLLLVLGSFLATPGECTEQEINDARFCVVGEQDGSITCSRKDDNDNTVVEPLIKSVPGGSSERLQLVAVPWGEPQHAEGAQKKDTLENIVKTYKYMTEEIYESEEWAEIRDECQVRNKLCSFWASIGTCVRLLLAAIRIFILSVDRIAL